MSTRCTRRRLRPPGGVCQGIQRDFRDSTDPGFDAENPGLAAWAKAGVLRLGFGTWATLPICRLRNFSPRCIEQRERTEIGLTFGDAKDTPHHKEERRHLLASRHNQLLACYAAITGLSDGHVDEARRLCHSSGSLVCAHTAKAVRFFTPILGFLLLERGDTSQCTGHPSNTNSNISKV